jgi:hypothetical protein
MKGTIETPQVAKIVMSLLTHLFSDVIISLEKRSSEEVVFGKQQDVQRCMRDVKNFVLTHPYGIFSIEVLNSLKRDPEDPLLSIRFKNFITELPNVIPMQYYIILDETYTTFEAFQKSSGGGNILLRMIL